jgi:hypothetical protein
MLSHTVVCISYLSKVRFELRRLGYTKRKCLPCLVPRTAAVNNGNKRLLSSLSTDRIVSFRKPIQTSSHFGLPRCCWFAQGHNTLDTRRRWFAGPVCPRPWQPIFPTRLVQASIDGQSGSLALGKRRCFCATKRRASVHMMLPCFSGGLVTEITPPIPPFLFQFSL